MKNLSFDHVHYHYSNEDETRYFYLGVMEGIDLGPVDLLGTPNMQIALGGVTLLFAPGPPLDPNKTVTPPPYGVYHIAFLVDDCVAATEYYRCRGATIAKKPFCANDSIMAAFLKAPDGMTIELKQNIIPGHGPCVDPPDDEC